MEKFCERLKEFRKEKGLSIEKLAKQTNLSKSAISRWELGQAEPVASSVIILAKFFNCSVDYLLGLED